MSTRDDGTVVQRFGRGLATTVERWMPSPFLFAILLSYLVFLGGVLLEGEGPAAMVGHWYGGFWALLTFGMQMVLILVTGYAIAYHPRVQDLIGRIAGLTDSGAGAVVLVGVVAMVASWIQWGMGLIVGAVLAREVGRQAYQRGIDVHYPLLCIAGYMGLGLTWHWGLAGSAPLLINTPDNVFIQQGVLDSLVPISETVFSSYSLTLTVLAIVYASLVLYLLAPDAEHAEGIEEFVDESTLGEPDDGGAPDVETPAQAIDQSRLIGGVIAFTGVAFTVWTFAQQGLNALNLNVVNFGFLFVGLLLFTRPRAYQEQFYDAITATGGIVLQFPFYAGIIGMMNGSGLTDTLANALVSVATPTTFPAIAWVTAGIINLFVPSGGGEWTVVGPTVVAAAQELGVPVGKATVAYAVGDAHTNLFQPFWALPLLGITGMRARDIFGYGMAMLLLLIPFLALALTFVPY
ncbi:short-chain fatty acid transporter [Halobaculum lipolyticum]|uniref:Short-chain fatty acid transporter n=1 Tax=Halobaculum lipolyticum TaxID=3032001 RepID=A0ABD5WI97_9EURY|nr:TIGR00366 family protein [Halobaculum sp. DT31]